MAKYDFSEIRSAVDARVAKGILPGVALCVNIDGHRAYEYTCGYDKDAIFRLASMTKPIAAVAVLRECEAGRLDVHDKVSKFIPAFAHMKVGRVEGGKIAETGDALREITLYDILTHSSGLGSGEVGDINYADFSRKKHKTLEQAVGEYARFALDFSPGEQSFYSGLTALDVAARIVELTSGIEYGEYVKKYITDPLGMKDTAYRLSPAQKKRVVPMYRLSDDALSMTRTDMGCEGHAGFPEDCVSGCTALFSTMEDYSRFAEMLRRGGEYEGARILSPQSVRELSTRHFDIWGYAVYVRGEKSSEQPLSEGSFGWSGAYSTHFWVDPALNLTAVYMTNLDNAGGSGAVTAKEFEHCVGGVIYGHI